MIVKTWIKKLVYSIIGISFKQFVRNFINYQMIVITGEFTSPAQKSWYEYFSDEKDIQVYLWNMYEYKNIHQLKEVIQYFFENIYTVYPTVSDPLSMWTIFCSHFVINFNNICELSDCTSAEKEAMLDKIIHTDLSKETLKIKFFKWLNK